MWYDDDAALDRAYDKADPMPHIGPCDWCGEVDDLDQFRGALVCYYCEQDGYREAEMLEQEYDQQYPDPLPICDWCKEVCECRPDRTNGVMPDCCNPVSIERRARA